MIVILRGMIKEFNSVKCIGYCQEYNIIEDREYPTSLMALILC